MAKPIDPESDPSESEAIQKFLAVHRKNVDRAFLSVARSFQINRFKTSAA
jgi:hypothetical protein